MSKSNTDEMTLSEDDLSDMDKHVLDWMHEHPDVTPTPTLLMKAFQDEGMSYSRQYYNSILSRLAEHGHVRNLRKTGVYKLKSDPRKEREKE